MGRRCGRRLRVGLVIVCEAKVAEALAGLEVADGGGAVGGGCFAVCAGAD